MTEDARISAFAAPPYQNSVDSQELNQEQLQLQQGHSTDPALSKGLALCSPLEWTPGAPFQGSPAHHHIASRRHQLVASSNDPERTDTSATRVRRHWSWRKALAPVTDFVRPFASEQTSVQYMCPQFRVFRSTAIISLCGGPHI